MAHWHFIPWTSQYLISGVIVLSISIYLLYRNRESWIYRAFFLFGLSLGLWVFFAFLHRNAPTSAISKLLFGIDGFFLFLIIPFLLLMFLFFLDYRKIYIVVILPGLFIGLIILLYQPFEIVWAGNNLGWSYRLHPHFALVTDIMNMVYILAVLSVGIKLIMSSKGVIKRKHTIILSGFLACSTGILLSNIWLRKMPHLPPFGGIFTTLLFLIIAYALWLPSEPIVSMKFMGKLQDSYLKFLNTFQNTIPGGELGESSFRFQDYLEAFGLKNVIVYQFDKLTFNPDKFSEENISRVPDNILKVIKEHSWAIGTVNDFTDILVKTYETLQLKSRNVADKWFEQMFHRHGGFLANQGMLVAMPEDIKIPTIFKELQPGKAYLFKEDTPKNAYRKLKEALSHGFECLCITKLHPQKIRERYDVREASMFWLTFKEVEDEKTINPKYLNQLHKSISSFVKSLSGSVVLLDCFREIVISDGFKYAMNFLIEIKEVCKERNANLLIWIDPKMFEEKQISIIKEELEEVK